MKVKVSAVVEFLIVKLETLMVKDFLADGIYSVDLRRNVAAQTKTVHILQ